MRDGQTVRDEQTEGSTRGPRGPKKLLGSLFVFKQEQLKKHSAGFKISIKVGKIDWCMMPKIIYIKIQDVSLGNSCQINYEDPPNFDGSVRLRAQPR